MFCCRGKRLANYLIENGCPVRRIEKDLKNKNFLVFFFESNDDLQSAIEKWKEDKYTYMIHNKNERNDENKDGECNDHE